MNIKKIAKKIKDGSKNVVMLTDKDNHQWIGDGVDMYLVDDGLVFTEENAFAILDVPADERGKWDAMDNGKTQMTIFDQLPNEVYDTVLVPAMNVVWCGDLITLFNDVDNTVLVMIKQSSISPADGKKGLRFVLRRMPDMYPVVMCGEDMLYTACLAPIAQEHMQTIVDKTKAAMLIRGDEDTHGTRGNEHECEGDGECGSR